MAPTYFDNDFIGVCLFRDGGEGGSVHSLDLFYHFNQSEISLYQRSDRYFLRGFGVSASDAEQDVYPRHTFFANDFYGRK